MYAAAADELDAGRRWELEVARRRFRVVRVERLVRIGPDGPEGPRPSDYDPQPPVKVQEQRRRGHGGFSEAWFLPGKMTKHDRFGLNLFHPRR